MSVYSEIPEIVQAFTAERSLSPSRISSVSSGTNTYFLSAAHRKVGLQN
jgi:hypothetical protein